jgi:hypothetical protein
LRSLVAGTLSLRLLTIGRRRTLQTRVPRRRSERR